MEKTTAPAKKTSKQKPTLWLIGILVILTFVIIGIRLLVTGASSLSGGDEVWQLEVLVSTTEKNRLNIHPPVDTLYIRKIQQNISHPGFKVNSLKKDKGRTIIQGISRKKGKKEIKIEFLLHARQTPFRLLTTAKTELTTQQREQFLADDDNLQTGSAAVQKKVKTFLQGNPPTGELVKKIFSFVRSLPGSIGKDILRVPQVLSRNKATRLDKGLVMVSLCRAAGIPARLVSGIILKDSLRTRTHYWVQVYQDNQWTRYDPHFGYEKTLPKNYLPFHVNGKAIVESLDGKPFQVEIQIDQAPDYTHLIRAPSTNITTVLDFTRLPLNVRNEIALLLLLPLGILITALFRHLVGIHSYGVFTPTLLALAVVYTNLVTSLIIFLVISTLAIGGRSLFPTTLSRTPRLAIIFTLIAIIMALAVSVLSYFDINQEGKIILLPIIILTTLVDNLYRTIEDRGIKIAMRRMAWTIIITLFCLPVIQFETLGHVLLQYPEIHLSTLALFLWISAYKGKTLINLPVLKLLAEPESGKPGRKRSSEDEG